MFLNLVFALFVLMAVRILWRLINEKREKEEVVTFYESPMTMSIEERIRRKRNLRK